MQQNTACDVEGCLNTVLMDVFVRVKGLEATEVTFPALSSRALHPKAFVRSDSAGNAALTSRLGAGGLVDLRLDAGKVKPKAGGWSGFCQSG